MSYYGSEQYITNTSGEIRMKKPTRSTSADSVAYVIAHAKWRKSRGRRPSESYGGVRNPSRALVLALRNLGGLNLALCHLNTLRQGATDSSPGYVWAIRTILKKYSLIPADIGTSEKELNRFASVCVR